MRQAWRARLESRLIRWNLRVLHTGEYPISVTPEEQATLVPIIDPASAEPSEPQLRGEEMERAFEELADLVPSSVPPVSSESLRREYMYSREDEQ